MGVSFLLNPEKMLMEKRPQPMTVEQVNQLAESLRPYIAKLLKEPVADTTVDILCIPILEDRHGLARMRFEIKVRGQDILPQQEREVALFLSSKKVGDTKL
jgi:hypothetical protein